MQRVKGSSGENLLNSSALGTHSPTQTCDRNKPAGSVSSLAVVKSHVAFLPKAGLKAHTVVVRWHMSSTRGSIETRNENSPA
jgi:hypothetical protein